MKLTYRFLFEDIFGIGDSFSTPELMDALMITRPTAVKYIRELLNEDTLTIVDPTSKIKRYLVVKDI